MQAWEIQQDSLLENIVEATFNKIEWTGEKKLQFAILQDAWKRSERLVENWRNHGFLSKRDRRLWEEDTQWVFDKEEDYPFSFLGICSSLALEPNRLKRQLKQLYDELESAASNSAI